MEQLGKAQAIRIRSHQGAYVVANDDKETVGESQDGSSPNAKWVVERVQGNPNVIRLKSCFGLYLTPSDGKLDWEPIPHGDRVKFKSCGEKLLQTNGEPISQNWTVSLMRWVFWHVEDWVFWHVEDFIIDESNHLSSALEDSIASEPSFQDISVADNSLPPPPAPLPVPPFNPTARRLLQESYDFGQLGSPVAPDAQEPQPDQVSNPSGQSNSPPPSPPSST